MDSFCLYIGQEWFVGFVLLIYLICKFKEGDQVGKELEILLCEVLEVFDWERGDLGE